MLKKLLIVFSFCLFFIHTKGQVQRNTLAKDTITDRAIEVPSDLVHNFDQAIVNWKKSKRKLTNCVEMNDSDIDYPDSVYIKRLHSLPTQMELAYNQIVRSYIDVYTKRNRTGVSVMLAASKYYNPMIENTLDKYGLPLELKYLPIIESALNPTARSRAGASGLWQFMLSTGRLYDLEINSLVDQRFNPQKSTDAAARYLRDLYKIYNDWNLVIAAYNCGPGNVNKAMRRSGNQTDYWAIYPYLPRETRGYVPAFIAATYVMNYYQKHNICPSESDLPMSTDTVRVNHRIHFRQISSVLNIPMEEIETLNPQFKKDIIPGDYHDYVLTLPSAKISEFVGHKSEILVYNSTALLSHRRVVEPSERDKSTAKKITYKVKKGDYLSRIARKFGVSASEIKKWNRLKSNHLTAGKHLIIYKYTGVTPMKSGNSIENAQIAKPKDTQEKTNVPPLETQHTNTQSKPVAKGDTLKYVVEVGDNISILSSRYNVSKEDIMTANHMKTKYFSVGDTLIIPLKPAK